MAQKLLDCTETAERLKLSPRTIRDMVRAGKIPAYRVGGEYRIGEEELGRWFDEHRVVTPR